MVKFLLHFSPKITVKTIDDAEGTPGASRQYTRFNAIVKPKIEKVMNACKWKREDVYLNSKFTDEFVKIFEEHGFKIERLENACKLDVLVNIESTEK
jgi:hypothetical protein